MSGEHFAGRLKELREAAGLTQRELAEKVGLSLGGLRDLEQEANGPTWQTVLKLCNVFGCSCEDFTKPPAEREDAKPGRPLKTANKPGAAEPAKRPRGRPRKAKPS